WSGTQLFTSDGTTPGTRAITNITRWSGGAPCGDGKVCFAGANAEIGVTDGTAEGTSILLSTAPGEHIPWAWEMTAFDKRAFFTSYDDLYGRCVTVDSFDEIVCGELWVSDGTAAGTHLFADLHPGWYPSGAYDFFPARHGKMYFRALEPGSGWCRVWVTDGTPEGSMMLPSQTRFGCNRPSASFAEAGEFVYYIQAFGEVMQTRGTAETTKTIWPEQEEYARKATSLASINDVLLINTVSQLWAFDGKDATMLFAEDASILGELDHRLYFAIEGELWSTDGTKDGTRRHFRLPATGGTIHAYESTPHRFFYNSGGRELFVSDGTEAGTYRLELTDEVARSSTPWELRVLGSKVLFTTETPELHMASDGTAEGTVVLGEARSVRFPIFLHQGRAYFENNDGILFTTDGTPEGTRHLTGLLGTAHYGDPPAYLGETAIFSGDDSHEPMLIRRDPDGTLIRFGGGTRGAYSGFTTVGDRVAFWHHDQDRDATFFTVTDGTRQGTKPLKSVALFDSGEIMPWSKGAFFGV
ncbi:MAG: hypothetical protein ACLGH0_06415, partial [Thermoanaerobaculia bacterium]